MSKIMAALTALALALPLIPGGAQAQVLRCVGADGNVSFSDQPCAPAQKSKVVKIYTGPAAPAPAPTTASTPGMSAEAAAHEKARQHKRAQSDASHQRIADASAKVRQIRSDNADPAKCAEAKRRMAVMEASGWDTPLLVKADIDYFHYQQVASLHCGN